MEADVGMSGLALKPSVCLVCVWVVVCVVVVVVTLMRMVRYQRSIWSHQNAQHFVPQHSQHLVIPRYANRPIPFPNRHQNHVHQSSQHHARLRLRISSMNSRQTMCGSAHLLVDECLSICHLKLHIFDDQSSSCSST